MYAKVNLWGSWKGLLRSSSEERSMSCWVKKENYRAREDSLKREMMTNFWSQAKLSRSWSFLLKAIRTTWINWHYFCFVFGELEEYLLKYWCLFLVNLNFIYLHNIYVFNWKRVWKLLVIYYFSNVQGLQFRPETNPWFCY